MWRLRLAAETHKGETSKLCFMQNMQGTWAQMETENGSAQINRAEPFCRVSPTHTFALRLMGVWLKYRPPENGGTTMHFAALMPMLSPGLCTPEKPPTQDEMELAHQQATRNVGRYVAGFTKLLSEELQNPWNWIDPWGLGRPWRQALGIEPWPRR